jgi:hypothetical protein
MSQKFSLVVEIKNDKPIGHAFLKEDAQLAKELFAKLREEGKEAYLFQHPMHDRRCKSSEQTAASVANPVAETVVKQEEAKPAVDEVKSTKRNTILGF